MKILLTNIVTLALGATLITLTGCATTTDENAEPKGIAAYQNDPRLGEQVDKICFSGSISGFSHNKDRTVVLTKGVHDDYMVEMFGTCQPLRNAQTIAMARSAGCLRENDSLIVSENMGFVGGNDPFSTQRCSIKSIYKWDERAKKATDDQSTEGQSTEDQSTEGQ